MVLHKKQIINNSWCSFDLTIGEGIVGEQEMIMNKKIKGMKNRNHFEQAISSPPLDLRTKIWDGIGTKHAHVKSVIALLM